MKFLIGFRKFTLTLLAVVLLTTFLLTGHIDGKSYSTALSSMIVAFASSNIGEHIINLGKEYFNKDK